MNRKTLLITATILQMLPAIALADSSLVPQFGTHSTRNYDFTPYMSEGPTMHHAWARGDNAPMQGHCEHGMMDKDHGCMHHHHHGMHHAKDAVANTKDTTAKDMHADHKGWHHKKPVTTH